MIEYKKGKNIMSTIIQTLKKIDSHFRERYQLHLFNDAAIGEEIAEEER